MVVIMAGYCEYTDDREMSWLFFVLGIDIHLGLRRVLIQKLADLDSGESSPTIRARVESAHKFKSSDLPHWASRMSRSTAT